MLKPDLYAKLAMSASKMASRERDPELEAEDREAAFTNSVKSVVARSVWVLVNGHWKPRKGIMR